MCEQQAFEMDFYKDKAKLIDKLLEEGPTSTEEEAEALVTLKRESRMQNKFFACHVVVLVLVVVLGMCLFARVAYYGFQTTGYDQQSLNGGLFILISWAIPFIVRPPFIEGTFIFTQRCQSTSVL